MEKPQSRLKGKMLNFLPRVASTAVTFKSPPISPRKPPPGSSSRQAGASVIPKDARRRLKNGSFDAREPGSPIVSCVGQVKKKKNKDMALTMTARLPPTTSDHKEEAKKKDTTMAILKLFKGKKLQGEKSRRDNGAGSGKNEKSAPSLGHLKQFASSRGVLANFDWRAHCGTSTAVAPDNCLENGSCSGDEEEIKEEGRRQKVIIIPHSAPIEAGNRMNNAAEGFALQPRKEINLWKRRTMVPPPPLRL
ncbi:uncharacterized protein At1g76070-like [Punica granatum]|uniref:Uncharacterized protein n=2 Tax=Punica granatum TaxID=22663 RepID=A0A218W310_PUNGR|nr:uncharacterized protein At1g76070-like [Punica granatum]OWM66482.1 hypothetical protein CDL15_Pgr013699 [Punica granatum]PKI59937.1 hypothetical protein CRG98_019710 [Punica granatum]